MTDLVSIHVRLFFETSIQLNLFIVFLFQESWREEFDTAYDQIVARLNELEKDKKKSGEELKKMKEEIEKLKKKNCDVCGNSINDHLQCDDCATEW